MMTQIEGFNSVIPIECRVIFIENQRMMDVRETIGMFVAVDDLQQQFHIEEGSTCSGNDASSG